MSATRQRILLVEDEFLVATLVEDMLEDLGHAVAGSAQELDAALAMARSEAFDVALLDLQIGGSMTYPVADALLARGIPFVFVTGRGAGDIAPAYAGVPLLQKPFRAEDLAAAIDRLVSGRPSASR